MINEELTKKIHDVFSDGVNLLGNNNFNDDEIDEIKEEFRLVAKRNFNSFNYSLDEISFFVIVVINKLRDWDKEWSENGFWDQINQVFDDDYYIYILLKQFLNKLYDSIDELFKKYNRILFRTKGNKRAFAQTFLYHALAPRYSFGSFVDLAWKKYFDDLECDYTSSDLVFCEYVVNSLKKKIQSPEEETDILFGSNFYKLRTAFKYGIVQNTEKTIKLFDSILLSINKVDRNSEDLENNTINNIISSVVSKNKSVVVRKISGEKISCRTSNTAHTFNQLKPVLNIDLSQHERPTIRIVFPRLILLGSDNKCSHVDLSLYKEMPDGTKQLIKSFPRRFFKCNGEDSYTLSAFSEELTDIYFNEESNFHYEFQLVSDNCGGYYSKKEFYRDFLVFGLEKEISKNPKPGSYYLVIPKQFDVNLNLHLLKKDYRYLWKNIINIVPDNFDSVEYLNTDILFSEQGMSSNVKFENVDLMPLDQIKISKDSIDYELFTSFSSLLINKDDSSSPEKIRVRHIFRDINGNTIIDEEKRLSELPFINHRYIYRDFENQLCEVGYHTISVMKIEDSSHLNKYLLNKNYIIDPKFTLNNCCFPYIDGGGKGIIHIFDTMIDYDIELCDEFSEFYCDRLSITVNVQNPFLFWSFGTSLPDFHYSPLNIKKPIIISLFNSTNETIFIKSAFPIEKMFFKGTLSNNPIEVFKGSENGVFLLSQFINAGHNNGYFYLKIKGKEFPLFSIIDRSYFADSINLQDCVSYENKTLKVNLKDFFVHDRFNYNVYLSFNSLKYHKRIEIPSIDGENIIENIDIDDGEYSSFVSFEKVFAGDIEPEVRSRTFNLIIGDINKKVFEDINQIEIKPAKNFLTGEKLKMNGFYIDNISYYGYDDTGDCVFDGFLRSKSNKPQKIRFTHRDGRLIKNLLFVFGKDGEITKKVNFDVEKCCFTTNPLSDNVVEFKTIYYKCI